MDGAGAGDAIYLSHHVTETEQINVNKHALCLIFVCLVRNSAQRVTDPFVCCFFISVACKDAGGVMLAILSLKSLDGWWCGKPPPVFFFAALGGRTIRCGQSFYSN
jgi:hypothetical protein